MPRKYNVSDAVKKARKKARPGRKPSTEKWINVRFPVEFVEKHRKPGEAFHVTVEKKFKRKRPAGTNPPAEKDKRP